MFLPLAVYKIVQVNQITIVLFIATLTNAFSYSRPLCRMPIVMFMTVAANSLVAIDVCMSLTRTQ